MLGAQRKSLGASGSTQAPDISQEGPKGSRTDASPMQVAKNHEIG